MHTGKKRISQNGLEIDRNALHRHQLNNKTVWFLCILYIVNKITKIEMGSCCETINLVEENA